MPGTRSQFVGVFSCSLVLALGLSGCNGSGDGLPRQAVSGTVTFGGQPLATGAIQFVPAGGMGAGGGIVGGAMILNGKYSIPRDGGLIPGKYKVSINSGNATGERPKAELGPGRVPNVAKELIPVKYNSGTTLEIEIKEGGSSALNFTLEK